MRLRITVDTDDRAASLHQHRVSPDATQAADPRAPADLAKPARPLQPQAGLVFRERGGLQRPDAVALRLGNFCPEQGAADALSALVGRNIHADFGDAGVTTTA